MSKFAVGYQMKKKMAKGGHLRGVHKPLGPSGKGGQSDAGNDIMSANEPYSKPDEPYAKHAMGEAKRKHGEKLAELKSMPKPNIKGLAEGGDTDEYGYPKDTSKDKPLYNVAGYDMKAKGGDVDHEADMVHRILKKCYSEGGKIANGGDDDLSRMADGAPNNFDDLALRDDLDSSYNGSNSGDETGDDQETEDRHDIVKRIMKSQGKKDRMPRPA